MRFLKSPLKRLDLSFESFIIKTSLGICSDEEHALGEVFLCPKDGIVQAESLCAP